MTSIIERLSNFDFTLDESNEANYLKRKDEIDTISNALSKMQGNIVDLIKNINEKAEQVASSSEELSSNSEETTSAANKVSKVVEDIAGGASSQASDAEKAYNMTEEFGKQLE